MSQLSRYIKITPSDLSTIFWSQLFYHIAHDFPPYFEKLKNYFEISQQHKAEADYNGGSIAMGGMISLFAITHYFLPKRIIEVGTYIGNSAYAIACGISKNKATCQIYTCDWSNDIKLSHINFTGVDLVQFPKTSSNDMFQSVVRDNLKFDLVFIDGRLNQVDAELLPKIIEENALIILDDFSGIEKGVNNTLLLAELCKNNDYLLILPCARHLFSHLPIGYELTMGDNKAVLLPKSLLQFFSQY